MTLEEWGQFVGEEARKNFHWWLTEGFYDKFLSGEKVLDVGYAGYLDEVRPITPKATGVGLDFPGYDGRTLPFETETQDAVFASHCLEHIEDYRGSLADWFRVLKIGGFLIVAVPHQYLYERNLRLPSRFNMDHRRLYTPGSLLCEVEEALDPLCYRLRLLQDNDANFDYSIEPEKHATGSYEILMVLEKIARPVWAEDMLEEPKIHDEPPAIFVPLPRPTSHSEIKGISSGDGPRTIVAFKMDHLGDFVLATPSFNALRRAFPEAHITLVCGDWNADRARELQLFDEVLAFSLFTRNAALNALLPLADRLAELQALLVGRKFDLAIDLRVDDDTRVALKQVNASLRAGIGHPRDFNYLDIALDLPSPTTTGKAGIYNYDAAYFSARIGENRGYELSIPAGTYPSGTTLVWGPYRSLPPSRYLIRLRMQDAEGGSPPFDYDVVCQSGNRRLAQGSCDELVTTGIWLDLREPVTDLEVRIWARGEASSEVKFRGCTIAKEGAMDKVHQSEIMAMLVALVEQRMHFPPVERDYQ